MSRPIKVIERPKKPGQSVRQRQLEVRPSIDEVDMSYHFRTLRNTLLGVEEDVRYIASREWRTSRRERLRASRLGLTLWLYGLFGVSRYKVLRSLLGGYDKMYFPEVVKHEY